MAARDFIISFFADTPQLTRALAALVRPPLIWSPQVPVPAGHHTGDYRNYVQGMGNSIQLIFNQVKHDPSDTLGRVCVMGFSEGGSGVDAILGCSDASGIDTVINCDGMHTTYVGQTDRSKTPSVKLIDPAALGRYIAFAKLAAQDPPSKAPGRMMVLTHSSVRPTYVSTTETMGVVWEEATRSPPPVIEDPSCGWYCPAAVIESDLLRQNWPNASYPLGMKLPGATITSAGWTTVRPSGVETNFMPEATFSWYGFSDGWSIRRIANGLYVFGWAYPTPNKTKDPTGNRDHVFQAQMVLPAVATAMLVRRWNPSCVAVPVATQGYGAFGEACSTEGGGSPFDPGSAVPLPAPDVGALPDRPLDCPVVPGQVIVGRPGDPCFSESETGSSLAVNLLAAGAGALAGYYGGRWAMRKFGKR